MPTRSADRTRRPRSPIRILRPYAELEEPGSLYLAGLAIEARCRGARLGRGSTICFAMNTGAYRLYERRGYVATDRRALVPHPTLRYAAGDAVLLVKTLD